MASLDVGGVVLVAERPADLLGQPGGDGDGDGAAGLEDPGQFAGRGGVVGDVLHDLGAHDAVEGVVGEGQAGAVAVDGGGRGVGGDLARLGHGVEQTRDVLEVGQAVVEGHDVGAAAEHLEGVASGTGPHVQDQVAGVQAQAGEVDGEHGLTSFLPVDHRVK